MMHKTAYEVRISDWSSDVCSSDLVERQRTSTLRCRPARSPALPSPRTSQFEDAPGPRSALFVQPRSPGRVRRPHAFRHPRRFGLEHRRSSLDKLSDHAGRSEEHTSELQSLMRISYAVFCLKKKKKETKDTTTNITHLLLQNLRALNQISV